MLLVVIDGVSIGGILFLCILVLDFRVMSVNIFFVGVGRSFNWVELEFMVLEFKDFYLFFVCNMVELLKLLYILVNLFC